MIDLSKYRIIDLSLSFKEGMPGFSSEVAKTIEKDGWNARTLHLYSHAGTHMDAPFHFGVSEQSIDEYPPDAFAGKAWVIRLDIDKDQALIGIKELGDTAQKVKEGDSLIFATNWSRFLGQSKYRDALPRISKELALWLVENKIKMLGVEPPSVADVNNLKEVTEIHKILLGGGIVIIEGLTNLDAIKRDKVFLLALPLKIKKGDGAPARVIAFEDLE